VLIRNTREELMQRVYITLQFKKVLLAMVTLMLTMVVMSALVVGVGNKSGSSVKKAGGVQDYSLKGEDIQIKNSKTIPKIKVYISKLDKVVEFDIEEYVRGVVAGEMPAGFEIEALKAQAVAARTYGLAHMAQFGGTRKNDVKGADLDDTTNSQVYMSKDERMSGWDKRYAEQYWNKITDAVNQTAGQVLTYEGKLVLNPSYFAISSGKTENAAEVFASDFPYLKSVKSEEDKEVKDYQVTKKYTYTQLANTINSNFPSAKVSTSKLKSQISILERTTGAESVKKMKVGNITITGSQFREILDLRSTNFSIKFNSKDIEVSCKGYGHGVGMSQWGAGAMAKEGKSYTEILTHYYQGVKIEKIDALK
jgi:stage II sporulation protein D